MFDNVKFEGTINLGAICVALIQLISAYAVLVRVRAIIEEHNIKLPKLPGGRRKTDPPIDVTTPIELPPAAPDPANDNQVKENKNGSM